MFLPQWVMFLTDRNGIFFFLSRLGSKLHWLDYVSIWVTFLWSTWRIHWEERDGHGGIHTSYVFEVKLENKIHISNIVCWVQLKEMRVRQSKFKNSFGGGRGWRCGDGFGHPVHGPWIRLFYDWSTSHSSRNITQSFNIQDTVFNSLKLKRKLGGFYMKRHNFD